MKRALFHLAFPVDDLEKARSFYVAGLGCKEGRSSKAALAFDLGGHQIIAHLTQSKPEKQMRIYPRHFGLIFMQEKDWQELADRAKANGLTYFRPPSRRFTGTRVEHLTFFLEDPSHNLLEFKHYKHETAIFGERDFPDLGDMAEEEGELP